MNTVQYKPRSEVQVQSCVPPWSREDPYKKKKKKLNNEVFKIFIQTEAAILNLGTIGALTLGVKVEEHLLKEKDTI